VAHGGLLAVSEDKRIAKIVSENELELHPRISVLKLLLLVEL
jgi:hypothetical protein